MTPEQRVSECSICAAWVLRCAHFGECGVVIADADELSAWLDNAPLPHVVEGNYYVGSLPLIECVCGLIHAVASEPVVCQTLAEALAAFHAAEEHLLRGGR